MKILKSACLIFLLCVAAYAQTEDLGKEGIDFSWIRFSNFNRGVDFFPPLSLRSTALAVAGVPIRRPEQMTVDDDEVETFI